MLEGLVTWVLNNYVGEYLENLNADQISVALLQGQVELENVPLRRTALQKYDIPLEVRSGVIGKLTLSVPITHIRSEPWVLKMSDLLVLLGPNQSDDNVEAVEKYEQTRKEQQLEELEAVHKRSLLRSASLEMKVDDSQNGWWGASVVSAVSNNIQLILDNVHIRYEDNVTMPDGSPFHFGFRIQNISIQTTNAQWKPGFVRPTEGVNVFKKLDIKGFSVFWNCAQEVHLDVKTPEDLKQILSPLSTKQNTYILRPFSMQVRMEKNTSKLPLKSQPPIPRFKFDLRPEMIELEISKRQLAQIRLLTTRWSMFDRARQHRKWRPLISIKQNPKQWWKFACGRVVEENRRQQSTASKQSMQQRARLMNGYCRAYRRRLRAFLADEMAKQQKLVDPNVRIASATAVNQEDVAYMKQIEHDSEFTYNELQLFRDIVFRKYLKELEQDKKSDGEETAEIFELVSPDSEPSLSPSKESSVERSDGLPTTPTENNGRGFYGWVSSWFGGEQSGTETTSKEEINRASLLDMWPKLEERHLPPNLRRVEKHIEEELLDVLSESWDDSTVLRRDTQLAEVILQLEQMIIRFVDDDEFVTDDGSRVLALDMRDVASRVFLSPREHRTEVSLSVNDMSIQRLRVSPQTARSITRMLQTISNQNSYDDLVEDDSLMSGVLRAVETEVLFAVGRTKEAETDAKSERALSRSVERERAPQTTEPLLKLFYRRLAPRLNIFHEIKAQFLPISIVYDEDALDGLANLFDTNSAFDNESPSNQRATTTKEMNPNVKFLLTVNVPEVQVELRTKKSTLGEMQVLTESIPFASASVSGLSIGIASTERHLTRMKFGFDTVLIVDLYEKTDWPLLRTIPPIHLPYCLRSRSASSPNLVDLNGLSPRTYSTSFPLEVREIKDAANTENRTSRSTKSTSRTRKTAELLLDNDFGHWDATHVLLNFTFVDDQHPQFESEHKCQHCTVKAKLSDVEIGMNQRTWTMLLDFFGALGQKSTGGKVAEKEESSTSVSNDPILEALLYGNKLSASEVLAAQSATQKVPSAYVLAIALELAELSVNMNYPVNETRLGMAAFSDVDFQMRLNLNNVEDPMRLGMRMTEFTLLDSTPFYSRLYSERCSLKPNKNSKTIPQLSIDVLKYRTDDLELKRKFDLRVDVVSESDMSVHYIHTNRYFCAFMDFWLNFADLQDQPIDCQKTRCLLNVNLNFPITLILPLNQHSDQVICLEADSLKIDNEFRLGSQLPELEENAIEWAKIEGDDYDCLVEKMRVECAEIRIGSARRKSPLPTRRAARAKSLTAMEPSRRQIGRSAFENFHFEIDEENVLNRQFQLNIGVYRNLSSFISHNLPELSIITRFEEVELRFTTEFYRLLRGVLEKNLGEELIPVPETIPLEILQSPDRAFANETTGVKYVTFANRMIFRDVKFHFLTPNMKTNEYEKFGVVILDKARISFDSYIDNQSELDLICESNKLIDTRFDHLPVNLRPNVFNSIVSPRNSTSETTDDHLVRLMSEAHVMMRQGEAPIVTLVLANARVLLLIDWLNQAKDFVLLNSDFQPPIEHSDLSAQFDKPKDGVLVRNVSSSNRLQDTRSTAHTITLKITLKESDLVLLEDSSRANSLALIAHTTAVLSLNDAAGGVIEAQFEVQNMCAAWCLMSAEETTRCQLTNDFDLAVTLSKEIPQSIQTKQITLNALDMLLDGAPARQHLHFDVGEVIGRMSYKDLLVVQSVVNGAFRLSSPTTPGNLDPLSARALDNQPSAINIRAVEFKAPNLSVWLLDDSQGVALPLARLVLKQLNANYHVADRMDSNFQFSVDYFNQRLFGWEPLVEPWRIDSFLWQQTSSTTVDCPLDLNVTPTFVQQVKHFAAKWTTIKRDLESDLRSSCVRQRSDHLPYLIRNETGSSLLFTTAVDEVIRARAEGRKTTAKWFTALADSSCTFEFPNKILGMRDRTAEQRRLVIRVDGWDEISPVSVDSVGTYFRVVRTSTAANRSSSGRTSPTVYVRIVLNVSVEPDGRKVVTVRSALQISNQLADPVLATFGSNFELQISSGSTVFAPLRYVVSALQLRPLPSEIAISSKLPVSWKWAERPGQIANRLLSFDAADPTEVKQKTSYCVWTSVKHELYPEHQPPLCGHSILLLPAMNVLNLLPTDVRLTCNGKHQTIQAGQRLCISTVNPEKELVVTLATDRFRSLQSTCIERSALYENGETKRILMRMQDAEDRELHVYLSVSVVRSGALNLSLWVPFWIVNRSGIPLVIKQTASDYDAAGQMADHEKAKDRNPLMFSFSDDTCPMECVVRVGRNFADEPGFKPKFSSSFSLTPGVQALKLQMTHDQEATRVYSIGVEVRAGSGRYKDTQVVLFEPRYHLNNRSSHELLVCHQNEVRRPSRHVRLSAQSQLIWYENTDNRQLLCVRRNDVPHWSCPFRIDQIGSFHLTMRDHDETPRFVRAEVTLVNASFWTTFTDAEHYPPPIRIENLSDVPVLYHQTAETTRQHRLRTICKANSTVDYAWDDLYGDKLLTLQVFENQSNVYDPSKPSVGPKLIYENHIYIQFAPSFVNKGHEKGSFDEEQLVMSVRKDSGKIQLSRLNEADSTREQLWSFTNERCLENLGFNYRNQNSTQRFVLDVVDAEGISALMMCPRNQKRDQTQRWRFSNDGRLHCGLLDRYVELRGASLFLSESPAQSATIPRVQLFRAKRQKPGSGVLDVQCLHVGPTLVVRISDHSNRRSSGGSTTRNRTSSSFSVEEKIEPKTLTFDVRLEMPAGAGISLVNGQNEELIYARLRGVELLVVKKNQSYQLSGYVNAVQADNQLLGAEYWPVLYCETNALRSDDYQPIATTSGMPIMPVARPALKLELSWSAELHYDAFDCFRIRLGDACLLLDELLLWKLAHFVQETNATQAVQPEALQQPPNLELDTSSTITGQTRRCYFGTLEIEFGALLLSAKTVPRNSLPQELRQIREALNMKLVGFENALVQLPAFRQFHYFETLNFLLEALSQFYSCEFSLPSFFSFVLAEIKKQTFKILVTMDAFGNPLGLASDIKESFQGLIFEGDVGAFVSGVSYGLSNSASKFFSSAAHGVGTLTFDEQHERWRRRMVRSQSQRETSTALTHLYGGVKGLGVGVAGLATALPINMINGMQKSGMLGLIRGVATGAVDMVTKPTQGVLDLLEGTASAVKDVTGGPMMRKSQFPERRVRLPRVCTSLQSLLPFYSTELAEAQQELLRIIGYSSNEILLDVMVILSHMQSQKRICHRALICSEQCYILRQIGNEPNSVIERIVYRSLRSIQPTVQTDSGLVKNEVIYETQRGETKSSVSIWCTNRDVAVRFADRVMAAKQRYDHSKRTVAITNDMNTLTI
ncbi:hypothetical protein M3Y98_00882500 [Aphelenchoides besseyi]|nr:hypothetical protein M3Y98_00882500 [Aphelenchoides besseyi]